jgi:hypothetical protein
MVNSQRNTGATVVDPTHSCAARPGAATDGATHRYRGTVVTAARRLAMVWPRTYAVRVGSANRVRRCTTVLP